MTKCPKDKIINPVTGRCVLKSGKIGQSLLTKKSPSKKSPPKKCPSGKIMNPATGRCVSKTGKIGQSMTPKKKSPSKAKLSPELEKILHPIVKCGKGKKYNVKTGRCVSVTSKSLTSMSLVDENKIIRKRMVEQLKKYIKSKGGKGYSKLGLEGLKQMAKKLDTQ